MGCLAASQASTLDAGSTTHTPVVTAKYIRRLYIYQDTLMSLVFVYIVIRKDFVALLL